jgi:hypothetical protein
MRVSLPFTLLLAATAVEAIESLHAKVKHLKPVKRSIRTQDAVRVRQTSKFLNKDTKGKF